jgi:hypothetical protein
LLKITQKRVKQQQKNVKQQLVKEGPHEEEIKPYLVSLLTSVKLAVKLIRIVCGVIGSMALKSMFKSKTLAKILGGMGVAVAVPLVATAVVPSLSPNMTKAVTGIASYLVGGVETLVGSAIPMFLTPMMAGNQRVQSGAGLTMGGTL